jgi:DNA-binding NarL/FixJ family response regulator
MALLLFPTGALMNFSKLASQQKIRLLLAEDHTILRQGLARMLEQESDIEIVGEAENGEQAVRLAAQVQPDVVLMDMGMPVMDGIEAAREIHRTLPEVRIIALSMHEDAEGAETMLAAGASLYLVKTCPTQEIIQAIRSCAKSNIP